MLDCAFMWQAAHTRMLQASLPDGMSPALSRSVTVRLRRKGFYSVSRPHLGLCCLVECVCCLQASPPCHSSACGNMQCQLSCFQLQLFDCNVKVQARKQN